MQVTVQILILLLSRTSTATTGGLESVFNQKTFGMEPETVLVLSITWSIFSCVRTHTKIVSLDKGFCGITSKIFIFWGDRLQLHGEYYHSLFCLFHQWDSSVFSITGEQSRCHLKSEKNMQKDSLSDQMTRLQCLVSMKLYIGQNLTDGTILRDMMFWRKKTCRRKISRK